MGVRRIEPMPLPCGITKAVIAGPRPMLEWKKPTDLFVDETYQRDLSRKSLSLIRQMVEHFAWNRMKPPIVVKTKAGLHIIDGQHTAIAAASLGLQEIPIFIVEADALDERARAFVGHNTDRITISPINIHKALLAAGDQDAIDVDTVCKRAGVRIRMLNQSVLPAIGDRMAIGTIRRVVKRRGVMISRKALEALVKARRAPIAAEEILAAEEMICIYRLDVDQLARIVRIEGDRGLAAARTKAIADRAPIWRMLVQRYATRWDKAAA